MAIVMSSINLELYDSNLRKHNVLAYTNELGYISFIFVLHLKDLEREAIVKCQMPKKYGLCNVYKLMCAECTVHIGGYERHGMPSVSLVKCLYYFYVTLFYCNLFLSFFFFASK